MRLLLFALCLSALSLGSYAVLTRAPVGEPSQAPGGAPVAETLAPRPAPPPSARPVGTVRQPVTAGAAPARASTARPASRPTVRTRVTTETYAVGGQTPQSVLASMAAAGPRVDGDVFFGLTVAEIGLRYEPSAAADGCVLTHVEVDLELTITLPEWTPAPPVDPALVRDWGRFRRALAAHEGRHRAVAETGAEAMAQALAGLRRESCAATEAEAGRRLARLELEVAQAQRRYDAETDHGRSEGAHWPQ